MTYAFTVCSFFSGARCVAVNGLQSTDPYHQRQRDSQDHSVDFSDAQIKHKCAERVTPNLDFMGTPLFDVEYLRNDTNLHKVATDH